MAQQAISFVLEVFFGLFIYGFLLRFLMQAMRAPFRNPAGNAIIALTDWAVKPLRRAIPMTIAVVVGQIVTSVLGGYAFARIDFKGRDQLFLLYLGSVMIPFVCNRMPPTVAISRMTVNRKIAIGGMCGSVCVRVFFVSLFVWFAIVRAMIFSLPGFVCLYLSLTCWPPAGWWSQRTNHPPGFRRF